MARKRGRVVRGDMATRFAAYATGLTATGCVEWTGTRNPDGYGIILESVNGRVIKHRAHRLALRLAYCPDPGPLSVLHTCHNPACCNVAHLTVDTHAENMRQRAELARVPRRTANSQARAVAVRGLYWDFPLSQEDLAKVFGTTRQNVNRIINRRTWATTK